jgi:hypothetical protein
MPGPSFCSPSWLKGRRYLSSRKDFNWQRRETARIATLSQQLFSDAGNGKWDPGKFLGEPRPPTLVCLGAGGMASDLAASNYTTIL